MNNGTRFALGLLSLALGILFATIFVNRIAPEEQVVSNSENQVEQSSFSFPAHNYFSDLNTFQISDGQLLLD